MAKSMSEMMARHGDIFTGVRQKGVILGLEFGNHPEGAVAVSRALYENGVWAIFSSLDKKRAAMEARRSAGPQRPAGTSWSASTPQCRARASCCSRRARRADVTVTDFDTLAHGQQLAILQEVARLRPPVTTCRRTFPSTMINLSENATYKVEAPDGRRWALRIHRDGYHSRDGHRSRSWPGLSICARRASC